MANVDLLDKRVITDLDQYIPLYEEMESLPEGTALKGKQDIDRFVNRVRITTAKRDLWYFLKNFVWTQDPRDEENPFKPFIGPEEGPEDYLYFQELIRLFQGQADIIILKSRQLRVTWFFCAAYLWDAMTLTGRRNTMQTKDESSANELMDRIETIIKYLPKGLRPRYKRTIDPPRIILPDTQSEVWGFPKGLNVGRSYTFTHYLVDEAWTQENLEETYLAAKPATTKLHLVATATKELSRSSIFFNSLFEDEYGSGDSNIVRMPVEGYKMWDVMLNRNGFAAASLFFDKLSKRYSITTENGKTIRRWVTTEEWAKEESKGYSKLAWEREQCGKIGIVGGEAIFETDLMAKVDNDIVSPLMVGKLVLRDGEVKFVPDISGTLEIYEYPDKNGQYTLGGDIGSGLSGSTDYSACVAGNKKTGKIAAVLRCKTRPIDFAYELFKVAYFYKQAFVVPEANSYGLSTIDALIEGNAEFGIPPYFNIYRPKTNNNLSYKEQPRYGWYTTWANKWTLIDQFAEAVRTGKVVVTSRLVANEMRNYIKFPEDTRGKRFGAAKGKDDCVISAALMYQGFRDDPYFEEAVERERGKSIFDDVDDYSPKTRRCPVTAY